MSPATKEALLVLVQLGLVEQRYRAVLEVLNDGATVSDVARRYGEVRQIRARLAAALCPGAPPCNLPRAGAGRAGSAVGKTARAGPLRLTWGFL